MRMSDWSSDVCSSDLYEAVAADPLVWEGLRNTLITGVTVSIIATALGFGAAYTDFRYKFFGKPFYLALALLPPTIPVVILVRMEEKNLAGQRRQRGDGGRQLQIGSA